MPKPYRKEVRYIQRVIVRILRVDSLFDMLRYDACHPETVEDVGKLERLVNGTSTDPDDHVISLIRTGHNANGPTVGRWESFGAQVLRVEHPDNTPPN